MTTKESTCAERVNDAMKNLENQIEALLNDPESDDSQDPGIGVETYRITKVWFSWGGPSDYIEIRHQGLEVVMVTYTFSDWFDSASVSVLEESPLWTYAEEVIAGDAVNYENN